VTITGDDLVKFVEEFIDYDPNHTLEQYTSQYGEPDLILFYPQAGDGTLANVFLSQGLVVFTHRYAGTVQQKWYFEPISQEEFLTTFGKNLTTQESGPEAFQ
jgi:hypothetical protein